MKSILNRIKNLFKIAKLLSVDDSDNLRFYTSSMLGKKQKILGFSPYGLMHNPPVGSMVLVFSQQGQESNGIGIADDPKNRTLKDLKSGEVGLSNYLTGHYIYFDENGLCTIVAKDLRIAVDDSVEINSTTVNINSTSLFHNSKSIGYDHKHNGSQTAPDGPVSDTGVPK